MFVLGGTPKKLLDDVSVDTVGEGILMDGSDKSIHCWYAPGGSFGGGSIIFEASPDNGETWYPITYNGNPAIFTTPQHLHLNRLGQGILLRASLVGSSGASHVFADIAQ